MFQVAIRDQVCTKSTSGIEDRLVDRIPIRVELIDQNVERNLLHHDRSKDPSLVRGERLVDPAA